MSPMSPRARTGARISLFDALTAFNVPGTFNPWRQADPLDVSPTAHFAQS